MRRMLLSAQAVFLSLLLGATPVLAQVASIGPELLGTRIFGVAPLGGTQGYLEPTTVLSRSFWSYGMLLPLQEPIKYELPKDVILNKRPLSPAQSGAIKPIERFHRPILLDADPADPKSMESALRRVVDENPDVFNRASSGDMWKTQMEFLPGEGDQVDAYMPAFRQVKEGKNKDDKLFVDGASLRFQIHVREGKPSIVGIEGGFAPDVSPEIMTPGFTDEALLRKAADRIKSPSLPVYMTRLITTMEDKALHAVNIYKGSDLRGQPVIVVVDIRSGQAWAFSAQDFRSWARMPVRSIVREEALPKARRSGNVDVQVLGRSESGGVGGGDITGTVMGRGEELTKDGGDHGPTKAMPLLGLEVKDDQGRTLAVVEENGSFVIPESLHGGRPVSITIRLDSIYGDEKDAAPADPPLVDRLTVGPGQQVNVTLNPKSSGDKELDEREAANVNTLVYANRLFYWIRPVLGPLQRLYARLSGDEHANDDTMPGNAYYDPFLDAFFLMRRLPLRLRVPLKNGGTRVAEITFENTAQPSIILHELTHRFVQMLARLWMSLEQPKDPANRHILNPLDPVMGDDVNEAIADIVSMLFRKNPILGDGFVAEAPADVDLSGLGVIRSGERTTAYDPQDRDPHARGAPLMEIAWHSYLDFIPLMGAAKAAEFAAHLFVRTLLYAQPGNVVSALNHLRLAATHKDGTMPYDHIIRAHAEKRGINLEPLPHLAGIPSS